MKRMITIFAFVVMVLISGCTGPTQEEVPQSDPNGDPTVIVDIKGFAFEPMVTTITSGTTVTWINRDSVSHTIIGDGFESDPIPPGGTFSKMFTERKPFEYYCGTHLNMQGRVDVDTV